MMAISRANSTSWEAANSAALRAVSVLRLDQEWRLFLSALSKMVITDKSAIRIGNISIN
jgi:hypothetical protein